MGCKDPCLGVAAPLRREGGGRFLADTVELFSQLRALGNPVDYRVFEGSRHDTRQIAFDEAIAWMRSLDPRDRPRQMDGPTRFDPEIDR